MNDRQHPAGAGLPSRHPPSTLARLIEAAVDRHGRRLAILAPGREPLTYRQLGEVLADAARTLAAAGYGRGSRIAVALPTGPEFAVAVLAVACAATCAPLNRALDEDSLATLLAIMRIDALLTEPGDSAATRAAARAGIALLRLHHTATDPAGAFRIDAAPRGAAPRPIEPVALDDIALLGHTSGTTARPKIVPFEQWRVAEAVRNRCALRGYDDSDRSLLLVPMHSLGTTRRILVPPLLVGGSVVCPTSLDGRSLVDVLATLAPTQLIASPAILRSILDEFRSRNPRPAHSLRVIYSGYSELPATLGRDLEREFGVPLLVTYGMSETTSIAESPLPPARAPDGSAGKPGTMVVAIADDSGRRLGAGETGEIIVRGAEVFAGYENDESANQEAFRDGWFRTGDAGWIDGAGFLFVSGRIKDIVNRGGTKIAPAEIEAVLAGHPPVLEAAVFGVPHPTLGEDLAAAVVPRAGRTVDTAGLRRFLLSRLPSFKVPAVLFDLPELPRGSLDKVNRDELLRLAQQRMCTAFEAPHDGPESEVAAILARVLALPRVGRHDNFFHLGGDSLRGMQAVAEIGETFGLAVSLELLFDRPTTAALTEALRPQLGERAAAATAAAPPDRHSPGDRTAGARDLEEPHG